MVVDANKKLADLQAKYDLVEKEIEGIQKLVEKEIKIAFTRKQVVMDRNKDYGTRRIEVNQDW